MTFSKKLIINGNVFMFVSMIFLNGGMLFNDLSRINKQTIFAAVFSFVILTVVVSICLLKQAINSNGLTKEERKYKMRKKRLASNLDLALNRNEISVVYQPIINAVSEAYGLEALIRWESESLGKVSPAEFIPVAEEREVIKELTAFVLRDAAATLTEFKDMAYISVNVSSILLNEDGWLTGQLNLLKEEFDFAPSRMRLEFTERLSIEEAHRSQLLELQEIGFKLIIDDFGTGYSAIGYLLDFPVEGIKLDRSFISQSENPQWQNMISLMVKMAKSLDLYVVAEGIETPSQAKFVKEIGCDWLQGYLESPPMDKKRLTSYVSNKRTLSAGHTKVAGTFARG